MLCIHPLCGSIVLTIHTQLVYYKTILFLEVLCYNDIVTWDEEMMWDDATAYYLSGCQTCVLSFDLLSPCWDHTRHHQTVTTQHQACGWIHCQCCQMDQMTIISRQCFLGIILMTLFRVRPLIYGTFWIKLYRNFLN